MAANVLHIVPNLDAALSSLTRVLKPDGIFIAPTFCHDETRLSWLVSRLLALTGFPGHRRFTVASLRARSSSMLPGRFSQSIWTARKSSRPYADADIAQTARNSRDDRTLTIPGT